MVVAVVVADHHDGLSAGYEVGQQARVEDLAVVDVLIRSPLVEDVDRPVFEKSGQQREALTLALWQGGRRQGPVPDLQRAVELELDQVALGPRIEVGAAQPQKLPT